MATLEIQRVANDTATVFCRHPLKYPMASQVPTIFRKPLVIGGLGLTAGACLLNAAPTGIDLTGTLLWGTALAGSGLWWLRQQRLKGPVVDAKSISLEQFHRDAVQLEASLQQLEAEGGAAATSQVQSFGQRLQTCRQSLERSQLGVMVIGASGVGKTALIDRLRAADLGAGYQLQYQDTPGLFGPEAANPQVTLADYNLRDSDLVLVAVAGDLVDAEYALIQALTEQGHRVMVVCCKGDQYLPDERTAVLEQVRQRLSFVAAADVVATIAAPAPIKRRQHQADGTVVESVITPETDLSALTTRVEETLAQSGEQLILATASRQLRGLRAEVQAALNGYRRQQALPIIERYQWLTGATAFASPLPTLDVVASAAINGQMVLDLGQVYQRSLSLEQAEISATALVSAMAKLGLVELSTQAISPLLKSHLATYAAGGVLQGLSAAYLTRVAGLSLVEYFETHPTDTSINVGRLMPILERLMAQQRRLEPLKQFVQQGLARLAPAPAAS